jgi:hypothetical protein
MTCYKIDSIEHIAFVLNGEKMWALWGTIYPNIGQYIAILTSCFCTCIVANES